MSRLHLLHLAAVLVSITCCSLLASATAESLEERSVDNVNGDLLNIRDTREAANQQRRKKSNRPGRKGGNRRKSNNRKKKANVDKAKNKNKGRKGRNSKTKFGRRKKTKKQKKVRRKKQNKPRKGRKKEETPKNKTDKKREKRKKRKNDRKTKGRGNGNRKRKNNRSTRQDAACVTSLNSYIKMSNGPLRTLDRQISRIANLENQIGKKLEKKDDFESNRKTLLNSLGGNATSPKCGGQSPTANDTEPLQTLEGCGSVVNTNCQPVLNSTTTATLKSCTDVYTKAITQLEALNNITDAAKLCTAVAAVPSTFVKEVGDCKNSLVNIDTEVKNTRKKCVQDFANCRSAERSSVSVVSKCKTLSGGVSNEEDAKLQLETLNKVSGVLKDSGKKFNDAITAAGLKDGPGADGQLPTARFNFHNRHKRQDESSNCLAVLNGWEAFNKSADAAAKTSNDPIDSVEADKATSSLQSVSNRTDLVGDLKSCKKETSRQLGLILAIVYIRYYQFLCISWETFVINAKITIINILFPNLIPATTVPPPPTTTTITTTGPKRRENIARLVKRFKL